MQRLNEIIRRLHDAHFEFSIIGGLAAVLHGTAYVTYDLDVCAPFTAENLRKLESAIRDTNPRWRIKDIPFELTDSLVASLKNIYLTTDLGKFDCLSEVKGIGNFDSVISESQLTEFPFGTCYILKISALIRAKEAIGRPHDFLVTTQLRAIQERNQN